MAIATLTLETGQKLQWVDITEQVQAACASQAGGRAALVYCPHTTAAVTVNEGWDPAVAGDVLRALEAMVPRVPWRHAEGNSPAHLLATLVGSSVYLLLEEGGRLRLGRWQRVFFCEFDGPRRREVWVRVL